MVPLNSTVECTREAFFFVADDALHACWVFAEFWEGVAHLLDEDGYEVGEESGFCAQVLSAEADGSAEDSSEDVASSFVAWCCAVGDCEGECSEVVCDDSVCDVDWVLECGFVAAGGVGACAGCSLDGIEDWCEDVCVVV